MLLVCAALNTGVLLPKHPFLSLHQGAWVLPLFSTMSSGFTTLPYDQSSGSDSVDPGFKLNTDSDQDIDLIPSLPPIMLFCIYGHNYLDSLFLVQVTLGHPFTSLTVCLPPVQLIPDVRLWNSAPCAKATSSLKVVMTLHPSESGGGLAVSHSIILPLADKSKVFSFQIRHIDDLTLEFSFYPTFGSKVIGCAITSLWTLKDLQLGNARTVPILDHQLHVIGEVGLLVVTALLCYPATVTLHLCSHSNSDLVQETQRLLRDLFPDSFCDAIDEGEGDIFWHFDLACFVEHCRWDNGILWELPTELSFDSQNKICYYHSEYCK